MFALGIGHWTIDTLVHWQIGSKPKIMWIIIWLYIVYNRDCISVGICLRNDYVPMWINCTTTLIFILILNMVILKQSLLRT